MTARLVSTAARFKSRIEIKGEEHGLYYPWWVAVFSAATIFASGIAAALQRDEIVGPAAVAATLIAVPQVVDLTMRRWTPWWICAISVIGGAAWMLTVPLKSGEVIDLAPVALCFLVGCVAATEGIKPSVAVAVASIAVLGLSDATGDLLLVYRGEVLVGLLIGAMLRWQSRALKAEHQARDEEHVRATLAERQRIAREIHDLVAHSLSVTMLHVTGARRALEQDADIPDAIEALTDAERIGRQAMADIRRTVSVLADDQTETRPLPGAADLEELVQGFRTAGLGVTWRSTGALDRLPPAVGLGLYRVVQESLANVVKHAPGAPARVVLDVGVDQVRVEVTNPLPASVSAVAAGASRGGNGLTGMASRAEQLDGRLESGPLDREWRVALVVPLVAREPQADDLPTSGHVCAVRRVLPS